MTNKSGKMVQRGKDGRFVKGESGNALGRPKGSKNVITLQKMALEEGFREEHGADMAKVLALIVMQALEGDKASQKLVWDGNVSKQAISEDKAAGKKQEINVYTTPTRKVDVIEGEFIDETNEDS